MSRGRGVCPGGVSREEYVCPGGVCVSGVGCIPACNGADTPSPVNIITDRCRNTTLPLTSFAGGNNQEYLRQNLNDIHLS